MRIGVNALFLIPGGVGGTEIHLRQLLAALARIDQANEYLLLLNRETGRDLAPPQPNFRFARQPVRAANRPARLLWEQSGLPWVAHRERLDVLLNPGFTAPVAAPCPNVTFFHDLQHKRHPEHFRWFDLPAWRFFLWCAVRRSRLLLTPSEDARRDLLRFYRLPESRVRTVPHGVDPEFFTVRRERCLRGSGAAARPFLLCASTLHPHKNLVPLVAAFAELRRRRPELGLVITGVRGFHTQQVEQAVRESGAAEAIELTGWLPRRQLYELFRDAWAFVYPSTFEGFGLPVLEALAAGIPTACSNIEPLRSVAGDAALQFDPGDPGALPAALERITADAGLRERLAAAGPERARQFSWEKAAQLTLAALHDAARPR